IRRVFFVVNTSSSGSPHLIAATNINQRAFAPSELLDFNATMLSSDSPSDSGTVMLFRYQWNSVIVLRKQHTANLFIE
ncbi:MAG: hypothetical protein LBK82_14660, partial [Planctomycetaceae bacterium]|nr:hypothetical protein [Planctomycetaceae bacterium]